ncbi:MAG: hypothetical protein AAF497_28825, partial [Planctomycetota bacterium]
DGWTRLFNDNWVRDVAVDPKRPNRIALITDKAPYGDTVQATGVWWTTNSGADWEAYNEGLPMLRGQHISFSSRSEIFVGLTGRGFYKARIRRGPQPVIASGFDSNVEADRYADLYRRRTMNEKRSLVDQVFAEEDEDESRSLLIVL